MEKRASERKEEQGERRSESRAASIESSRGGGKSRQERKGVRPAAARRRCLASSPIRPFFARFFAPRALDLDVPLSSEAERRSESKSLSEPEERTTKEGGFDPFFRRAERESLSSVAARNLLLLNSPSLSLSLSLSLVFLSLLLQLQASTATPSATSSPSTSSPARSTRTCSPRRTTATSRTSRAR